MDKKSIIAVVILAAVIIFYWPIMTKLGIVEPPEETAPAEVADTTQAVEAQPTTPVTTQQPTEYAAEAAETPELTMVQADTIKADSLTIETDKYLVVMSTKGGGPVSLLLKDYTYRDGVPVQMLPEATLAAPEASFGGGTFLSSNLDFACSKPPGNYSVGSEPFELVYSHTTQTGGTIQRIFTFHPDQHHFDFRLRIDDPSALGTQYRLGWNTPLAPTEPDLVGDWEAMQVAAMLGGSRESLDDFDDGRLGQSLDGRVAWAGVRSKYFAAVMIPTNRGADGAYAEGFEDDVMTADGGMMEERKVTGGVQMQFAAVSPIADDFKVYVGPLDYPMMSEYNVDLEDMLDIGTTPYVGWIIKPFAIGIMWIMPKLYDFIPNYGLVIILFALMVKIITLPLSLKSFKSMQAQKAVQPKMDELKTKYKKDPQRLNKEMMALYKKHGVNPISGCLPILPQMPLFFALFSVFRSTILLRDAPFFWFIDDLSRGATSLTDPYIILVLIMVGAQFISQKLTMPTNPQNKMFIYIMPFFFGFIFYKFAAGLVLYWICFSLFALLDYVIFKRPKKNEQVKAA